MAGLLLGRALAQVHTDLPGGAVSGVTDYVNRILSFALPIIGSLAVLMIVYAGYIYMTSQGNPDRVNLAKEIIVGVITGIVLLFTIRIILGTVGIIQ